MILIKTIIRKKIKSKRKIFSFADKNSMKHAINNQKKADRFNYNFSFYKENEIKHIISMLLIVVYLFCVCFFSLNPYNNNNFIHFYLKKKKKVFEK